MARKSPLALLIENSQGSPTLQEMLAQNSNTNSDKIDINTISKNHKIPEQIATEQVLKVDPKRIKNWELHDRVENELGDLNSLGNDMKANGQLQPCIVRPIMNNPDYDYELIAGERRWRAAQIFKLKLLIIVKKLSDKEAALNQISENINRVDISDYCKAMNYAQLIDKGILSQRELEHQLNINQSQLSRLLSFSHVPQKIWDAVGDMTKVSARTASEIRVYANKGAQYVDALIAIAHKIRTGKLGAYILGKEIETYISGEKKLSSPAPAEEIRNLSGRHLFTWRKDSNNNLSISFPKDIRNYIDKSKLEKVIRDELEKLLNELQENANQE